MLAYADRPTPLSKRKLHQKIDIGAVHRRRPSPPPPANARPPPDAYPRAADKNFHTKETLEGADVPTSLAAADVERAFAVGLPARDSGAGSAG